jgi:hypothetical protein
LTRRPLVIVAWWHQGVERRAEDGSAFGVVLTVKANDAVEWLTDLEIAAGMCVVCLSERRGGVNTVLEVFGVVGELAGIHGSG